MTQLEWWLVRLLACGLEADDRDAVLGDVMESGESVGVAMLDVAGLIARRQARLWTAWRPWVALLGVAGLAGAALSRLAFGLNVAVIQQVITYRRYGVRFETGVSLRQDLAFMVCLAAAVTVWSWICGFVLGSLSGRSVWLTWCVFYLVLLDATWARFVLAGNIRLGHPHPVDLLIAVTVPVGIATLLSSAAALWGAVLGVRKRVLSRRVTYAMAAVSVILAIVTVWMTGWYEAARAIWSGGVWHGDSWGARLVPFVLANWPAVWLVRAKERTA